MQSSQYPVEAVAVIGASGNIGIAVVHGLLAHPSGSTTKITLVTRASSLSRTRERFSTTTKSHKNVNIESVAAYEAHADLVRVLRGHQAVVSCLATFSIPQQNAVADACIEAGVERLIPSEYGVDTSDEDLVNRFLPVATIKREAVAYLKGKERFGLTWSGLIVGMFFDWGLKIPAFLLGHDLGNGQVQVVDGGTKKLEVTNIGTIGKAVAGILLNPEAYEASRNQYVMVNSFTVSQNEYIKLLEKHIGHNLKRVEVNSAALSEEGLRILEANGGIDGLRHYSPTPALPYPDGTPQVIHAAIFGYGGLNQYSQRVDVKRWNRLLGLPEEDLEATIVNVVHDLGIAKTSD